MPDNERRIALDAAELEMAKKATGAGLERARQAKELKEKATIPQQVAGSTYLAGIQPVPDEIRMKRTGLTEAIAKHTSDPNYARPALGHASRTHVRADKKTNWPAY